jgi:Peptidase_C39 like family
MTANKHSREQFRHARRRNIRRLGRLSVVPAAVIGAAVLAALPASQAFSAATGHHTDQATVVNVADARGQSTPGGSPSAAPKAGAATAAAGSNPATPNASPSASKPAATKAAAPAPPAKKELAYQYAVQINGWYCGPAAVRNALTTRGLSPSQDALANQLGTTENGTNSAEDTTRVLNAVTKTSFYHTTSIPDKGVTQQQINQLRADVVRAISHGYGVVANIVGDAQDVNGNWYSFGGGHYIAVVGYQNKGAQVKIADSANAYASSYWMPVSALAEWIGTRGYSS